MSREVMFEAAMASMMSAFNKMLEFRNGNTRLLEILMKVVSPEKAVREEAADMLIAALKSAGLMTDVGALDWSALASRRDRPMTWEEAVRLCIKDHNEANRILALDDQARVIPTLDDDSFVDPAIATFSMTLWERPGGGTTSAAQLLIRPTDVRGDESGGHPGEEFVMCTITREEMREMLAALDEDWATVVYHTGDPNMQEQAKS